MFVDLLLSDQTKLLSKKPHSFDDFSFFIDVLLYNKRAGNLRIVVYFNGKSYSNKAIPQFYKTTVPTWFFTKYSKFTLKAV